MDVGTPVPASDFFLASCFRVASRLAEIDVSRQSKKSGFTLVELLVVIGIIAVLVGILLPTLGRVRGQANTVACAAQLRGHMQGLLSYAAENRGAMPWGFAWQRGAVNAATGLPTGAPLAASSFGTLVGQPWAPAFSWQKVISDRATKAASSGTYPATASTTNMQLSAAFQCPEVRNDATFLGTSNHYGFHQVVLPNQSFEINPAASSNFRLGFGYAGASTEGGTRTSVGPAKLGQLSSDTAVLWDTFVLANDATSRAFLNIWGGWMVSDVDGARLWEPRFAHLRYKGKAIFNLTQPYERLDQGIQFPHHDLSDQYGFGFKWVNSDMATGSAVVPAQFGGPRFRHNKNTQCNVAFADGSVRTFFVNTRQVAYLDSFGDKVAKTDFLRSYLLIKAPGGLPQPQLPQPP